EIKKRSPPSIPRPIQIYALNEGKHKIVPVRISSSSIPARVFYQEIQKALNLTDPTQFLVTFLSEILFPGDREVPINDQDLVVIYQNPKQVVQQAVPLEFTFQGETFGKQFLPETTIGEMIQILGIPFIPAMARSSVSLGSNVILLPDGAFILKRIASLGR